MVIVQHCVQIHLFVHVPNLSDKAGCALDLVLRWFDGEENGKKMIVESKQFIPLGFFVGDYFR